MNLFLSSSVLLSTSSQRRKSSFSFPRLTPLTSFILGPLFSCLLLDHAPEALAFFMPSFFFSCNYSFLSIYWHAEVPITTWPSPSAFPNPIILLFSSITELCEGTCCICCYLILNFASLIAFCFLSLTDGSFGLAHLWNPMAEIHVNYWLELKRHSFLKATESREYLHSFNQQTGMEHRLLAAEMEDTPPSLKELTVVEINTKQP